jgi:hypothetical protein
MRVEHKSGKKKAGQEGQSDDISSTLLTPHFYIPGSFPKPIAKIMVFRRLT